ncbi:uncharacterized protein LOC100865875 isoform X1 [Apis florea]|uniref:uncharacterized protein LOC100865875 isoform X1 n=1 Tax=Apis florea TaxID=7463 RepID=UPI0012FEEA0D|nr:uncharacterized protein LOC100865875 isoform X1 [Apis florea]
MDCCNYVEAYAAGSHFYQQQHYFCYDNMNTDYGGYEPPPISNAIETSARYNGTVTPAYPIDYVYNPKEARLRKAMREQSRELSRRSILQSAIARASVIAGPVTSGGFLDHQHRFGCVSSANIPMNSSMEPVRVAEPWFQSTPRPKPIHSPRMTDWYGNVADPIERLQVMGAMHQRGLDKCKDVMRNQAVASVANTVSAECGATFSNNGYPVDFSDVNRERELRRQENMEYNEFTDGQKWHPYQNGGTAHQHPRTSHPPQMSNILHPNIQNPGPHGHGPWGQFCHNVLPHASSMPRNIGVRGPRHTVLLRDRVPVRHCEFPEETARMMYNPSKLDIENVRASYTPPEHQMPRMLETSVNSVMDSASAMRIRREDDGPRWEPNAINNRMSMDNLTATTESSISCEKERESRRSVERFEPKKKTVSKQPLPGFHQAFGSTEIGRFSRSEFFVNMVGESGASVEVADTESTNVSTDRMSEINGVAVTTATHDTSVVTTIATTTVRSFDGDDSEEASFEDSNNDLVAPTSMGMYCDQPNIPRWHSPHVGAIGSEI